MATKTSRSGRKSSSLKGLSSNSRKKEGDRRRKRPQELSGNSNCLCMAFVSLIIIHGFVAFNLGKRSVSLWSSSSNSSNEASLSELHRAFEGSSNTSTTSDESSWSTEVMPLEQQPRQQEQEEQVDKNSNDVEDASDFGDYVNPIFDRWDNTTLPTAFLDDYYSRRHSFPLHNHADNFSTTASSLLSSVFGIDRSELPVLIVGGSDGSGTRVVVDTLQRLGVPMVVDDRGTMDIHLSCLNVERKFARTGCPNSTEVLSGDPIFQKGWPVLVNYIMKKMRSVHYQWKDISPCDQEMIEHLMNPCLEYYKKKSLKLTGSWGLGNWYGNAMSIRYGFKAPVSMLLLPILQHLFGRIKFLHVVRDGRDVCLSSNTSPVDKFYGTFYTNATQRERELMNWAQETRGAGAEAVHPIMAIQLWNDWNVQVLEWERNMVANGNSDSTQQGKQNGLDSPSSAQPLFDYMVVRMEDLIDPTTRLAIVHQMADFVGSQKSPKDICCVGRQSTTDMGQSGLFQGRNRTKAQRRREQQRKQRQQRLSANQQAQTVRSEQRKIDLKEFLSKHEQDRDGKTGTEHDYPQAISHESQTGDQVSAMKEELAILQRERERLLALSERRSKTPEQKAYIQQLRMHYREKAINEENRGLMEVPEDIAVANVSSANATQDVTSSVPPTPRPDDAKALSKFRKDRFIDVFYSQHRELGRVKVKVRQEGTEQVRKRYGKWVTMLEAYPELQEALKKDATLGLETFGYESSTPFADFSRALQHTCDPQLKCPKLMMRKK